ncbi:ubiquitin elongating factor core-domain-containing protein [Suillus spraguei]|nr:ubiquitin elongating factor core-domain-containing protein [Suillus spraguei]
MENDTISTVLKVTLSKSTAEANEYDLVWLKHLQAELESEGYSHTTLTSDIVDRLLITRLELDAQAMSDDLEYVSVLASLPPQSVFEYLVAAGSASTQPNQFCSRRTPFLKTQQATALLDKLRDLIISYTGLNLQEPEMFPQPADPQTTLAPTEVQLFLQDLAARFTDPDELLNTLSTLVRTLVAHSLVMHPRASAEVAGTRHGAASSAHGSSCRSKAHSRNDHENAPMAWRGLRGRSDGCELERFLSLMGPLLEAGDVQSGVGMQLHGQSTERAAEIREPFMDARYTKMDRIDPYYFSVSTRIDLKEETRIKATSDEAAQWVEESKSKAATPNFISDIFYLCNALGHYGYIRTIQVYEDLGKTLDDYQRHHDMIAGDGSWMGTPQQAHAQAAIDNAKVFSDALHSMI